MQGMYETKENKMKITFEVNDTIRSILEDDFQSTLTTSIRKEVNRIVSIVIKSKEEEIKKLSLKELNNLKTAAGIPVKKGAKKRA